MKISPIYSQLISAKNGTTIPLTITGKTIESRYNPENDVSRFYSSLQIDEDFIVLLGIGSGLLLNEIISNHPEKTVLAVENSWDDLELISQIPLVQQLKQSNHIIFSTISEIEKNLIDYFLPVLFSGIKIIQQKAWILENNNIYSEIENCIHSALSTISADYSVQVHFGKIWHHNILSNLQIYEKVQKNELLVDNTKEAVVLAAGSSLDYTYKSLLENRDSFYIIATDTAYEAMNNRNISVDAVISLDGQLVSSNHFVNTESQNTVYLFDLCGNPGAVKKVYSTNSKNLFFFTSGHPLCNLFNSQYNSLIQLNAGSGTVTIAALDFAYKMGFKKIRILGADFSYINGKPYTSGTYLDGLYNNTSCKTITSEFFYSKLMFRTELENISKVKTTTKVLQSYKSSMEEYLKTNNMNFIQKDDTYFITNENCNLSLKIKPSEKSFEYNKWIERFISNLTNHDIYTKEDLNLEDIAILPLMSHLKNNDNNNRIGLIQLRNSAINLLKR